MTTFNTINTVNKINSLTQYLDALDGIYFIEPHKELTEADNRILDALRDVRYWQITCGFSPGDHDGVTEEEYSLMREREYEVLDALSNRIGQVARQREKLLANLRENNRQAWRFFFGD